MTISRINAAPDINEMVSQLEKDFRELKEAQRVGSDAVKTFMAETTSAWDYSGNIGYPTVIEKTITFTPDDTSGKNTAAAFRIGYKFEEGQIAVSRQKVDNFASQQWKATITGFGGADPTRAKFYVYSTGKGSITVT